MTKVLTVPEIEAIKEYADTDWWYFARAIEAAVIKRLAAGVSVELTKLCTDNRGTTHYGYTEDQLTTAIAAARVQENERCVQACAAKSKEYLARSNRDQHSHGAGLGAAICAELLSALLGKEAQS